MKHLFWILVFGCALAQAGAEQKGAAKPKAKPAAVALPAGAERVEEGVWRARDAQGRTWIYRKTPFGMVRMEEQKPEKTAPGEASPCRVVRVESGQAVFEKESPFGRRTWTRRLEELDGDERRALEEWKKAKQ